MRLLLVLCFALRISSVTSQTFSGATGSIPDNGPYVSFPISVTGLPSAGIDSNFGLESVCINIQHNSVGDLNIRLRAPDNSIINLSMRNGGSGNDYSNTCFVDSINKIITLGNPPFSGNWRPETPLYALNNGQNPNGTWELLIQDADGGTSGTLTSCAITFGNNPGTPFQFTSSNLPIIKINTLGQTIVDDPKIQCRMDVIDNGAGNRNFYSDTIYAYSGWIGIELRGSSSQTFPKKSYGVETRDSLQNDLDVPLLNMPAESDWVFNGNYPDKSFMRNTLAYNLYGKMGWYSSRTRYAEVFINGNYQGIYVICEKIKRDVNRIDIANLAPGDTTWPDISGGYILKIDKPTGSGGQGFPSLFTPPSGGPRPEILYDDPDPDAIHSSQSNYIIAYMDSFERALQGPDFSNPLIGYAKFADRNSFIDFFILNEITHCVDSYRISAFLYKKKSTAGGKLFAGPVWDFDIAWGNADYYNGSSASGWSYQFPYAGDQFQVPFWWSKFLQDSTFANAMKCRWNDLRNGVFATNAIHSWIDSTANYLNESQQRNFTKWPIMGVYVWPNPQPYPATYAAVIIQLKNWIVARLSWMDQVLLGNCIPTGLSENQNNISVVAYPNPAHNDVTIYCHDSFLQHIEIIDFLGRVILSESVATGTNSHLLSTTSFPKGIYLLHVSTGRGNVISKLILE